MKILRLTCSPRRELSESFRLSEAIVRRLLERHPHAELMERALADGTISHVDGHYARVLGTGGTTATDTGPAFDVDSPRNSLAESETLIRELEAADILVIGTPMHNYTVPSALKAWIDHVVRVHRTFRPSPHGKEGMLADRPTFIAVSAGGSYAREPGQSRQPDFLTPYLTAVLNTIGIRDITFFSVQRSARGPEALHDSRHAAAAHLDRHFSASAARP
ncbi:FMN dependent NADH:quinone oxidoreductase [Cupriavidus sp. H19C3]|uniref:FMN-dependent NADH-azoreductase n=1 Tax=Cupriavidus sp. H19C3 TaxID=3241603 RepID=UPI003BF86107